MEGDAGEHATLAEQFPRERQGAVELSQLVVDRYPQRLEGALGGVTAGEAGGSGDRGLDRVDELQRGHDRGLLAPADDRPRDRARVALLAEVAKDVRQATLVPFGHDLTGAQLLRRIHAHVERRVVGVGEAALAGVYLHRGHAKVEVGHVRAHALAGEQLQRLCVARADEAHRARGLGGQLGEALLGLGIAVDRHQRAGRAQSLGQQASVAAVAEGAVDRGLARLRIEQLEQLDRQHRGVRGLRRAAERACALCPGARATSALRGTDGVARSAPAPGKLGRPGLSALSVPAFKQRRRHAR